MSAIAAFIESLRADGVTFWIEAGQLRYRGPKNMLTADRLARMRERKLELLAHLDASPDAAHDVSDRAPLSHAQARLWFLYRLEGANATYNVSHAIRLVGRLDRGALARSFEVIVQRHATLRTTFEESSEGPMQVVHPGGPIELPCTDLGSLDPRNREREVGRQIRDTARWRFDLERGPLLRTRLLRLSQHEYILLMVVHHIVADGWSLGVLVNELTASYAAHARDCTPEFVPLPIQYADYARAQHEPAAEAALDEHLRYWESQLRGAPFVLELPCDRPRGAEHGARGAMHGFTIDSETTARIGVLGRKAGASLFMTLTAVFGVLLARYTGQRELLVGAPSAGRTRAELEPLIGFFVNTLALRLDLRDNPTFRTHLDRVRRTALDAFAHQDAPFERVVDAVQPDRNLTHTPLVQAMFRVQNATMIGKLALGDLVVEPIDFDRGTATYDLTFMVWERGEDLHGDVEYNRDLFDTGTIERMARHFVALVDAVSRAPDTRVAGLQFLDHDGADRVVAGASVSPAPPALCLHELVAVQAAQSPQALAVVHAGCRLDYRSLDREANRLAHLLHSRGVGPDVRVAVCMERSEQLLVAILAVLKAGGAYVPIDSTHPTERARTICLSAGAVAVVTSAGLAIRFTDLAGVEVLDIETHAELIARLPDVAPRSRVLDSNLAYVIYTSGSTGQPKGVMVEHRQAVSLVRALGETLFARGSRPANVALVASVAFDASVQQIFGSLAHGHCLHVIDTETVRDGVALRAGFAAARIEISDCTPSLLNLMQLSGMTGDPSSTLRALLVGGEPLSDALVRRLYADPGARRITLTNLYGPTECAVDTVSHAVVADQRVPVSSVPIGRPMAEVSVHILDAFGDRAPFGVAGEICIAGPRVGRGYLCDPSLTAQSFVPDLLVPGARMYRSGDWGRWLSDGTIEYLGRDDDQVKVRGYRIELGEIEAALAGLPGIDDAVVLAPETSPGVRELVAYIVTLQAFGLEAIREPLGRRLPDYMLPAHVIALERLPMNASGKLDRRALPAPDKVESLRERGRSAQPRGPEEALLVEIWSRVLGRIEVGVNEDYFGLGGDSIKALQVAAALRERGHKLEIRDLFRHPTIRQLGSRLTPIQLVSESGPIAGEMPLTPIQARFFDTFDGQVEHFNQALLLACDGRLDEARLRAAVARVQQHHDALRTRFSHVDGHWRQVVAGLDHPIGVDFVELGAAPDADRQLATDIAARQRDVRLDTGPLFRVVGYRHPRGDRVALICHHLVVDVVSWNVLLEDLARLMLHAADATLPAKSHSFMAWSKRLQMFSSGAALKELPYWRSVLADPPPPPSARRPGCYRDTAVARSHRTHERSVPLFGHAHRVYATNTAELLLCALARALAGWCGHRRTGVLLEGHGREAGFDDVDVSRTIGWFTCAYPIVLDLSDSDDIGRQIKLIKETVRAVPRGGVGYGVLKYLTGEPLTQGANLDWQPSISFNYLGQLERDVAGAGFARIDSDLGDSFDPGATREHALDIIGAIEDGCLQLTFAYAPECFDATRIELLVAGFDSALDAIIEHTTSLTETDLTPSDVDYEGFDIDGLDHFMDQLVQGR